MTFTPTPRADISELKSDVKTFCRKLCLLEYHADDLITDLTLDPSLVNIQAHSTLHPIEVLFKGWFSYVVSHW